MRCSEEHTVTLNFLRSELLMDIKQAAFVEADIMKEGEGHAQHQTFDICEDGNIDRVTRVLSLAFSECVELLYPFTKDPVDVEEVRDDQLVEDQRYILTMHVPETFSKTTVDLLEKYIHEFLICRVLADWFSITKPEAAANWKKKAAEVEESIHDAKSIRTYRIRRKCSPF